MTRPASEASDAARRMTVWRWRIFAATWLSYAGYYFVRKPFSVAKKDLGDAMDWDPEKLGYIGAVYLVTYAIGQFVSGAAGQKWGPRALLLLGMGLSIGANAAFGFTNNIWTFAVLMGINGLAQSTGWSNNVGTMGNWFRRKERGKVMGVWATNYQVGGVAASGLASFILGTELGFEYAFFAGSMVTMLVWIFVFFNQRNKPEDVGLPALEEDEEDEQRRQDEADAAELASGRKDTSSTTFNVVLNIGIIGAFYFFVKFIRYSLWSWAPYMLSKNYGLESDDAGYISIIFDVTGVIGVLLCGYLSDKYFKGNRSTIAFIFIVGMGLSCVALYFLGQQSVLVFAVCMGFVGFTLYGPDALMTGAAAIDVGSPRRATMAAGVINGMGSIGAIVQEFLLGKFLKDGSVDLVFGALMLSGLMATIFLGILLLRNKLGQANV